MRRKESKTAPEEMNLQRQRIAAAGKVMVVATLSDSPPEVQATRLFEVVSTTVERLGGWLVDDGVPGGDAGNFAVLMKRRINGELAWNDVCPAASRSGVLGMKIPYNMLSRVGYPCWAMGGKLMSIDLFNPQNELFLEEEPEHTLWQLIPWPPRFLVAGAPAKHSFFYFKEVIKAVAEGMDAKYCFGGKGLPEALTASRFADWGKGLKPLPTGTKLSDLSYPYMVIRKKESGEDAIDRIMNEELAVENRSYRARVGTCEVFGQGDEFVLIGIEYPPFSFPDAADMLGYTVGELLRKPYVMKVAMRRRG